MPSLKVDVFFPSSKFVFQHFVFLYYIFLSYFVFYFFFFFFSKKNPTFFSISTLSHAFTTLNPSIDSAVSFTSLFDLHIPRLVLQISTFVQKKTISFFFQSLLSSLLTFPFLFLVGGAFHISSRDLAVPVSQDQGISCCCSLFLLLFSWAPIPPFGFLCVPFPRLAMAKVILCHPSQAFSLPWTLFCLCLCISFSSSVIYCASPFADPVSDTWRSPCLDDKLRD